MLAVDPTRRRTGGALLGDRIRMNSLRNERDLHALDGDASPARGDQHRAQGLHRVPAGRGFDLVIVETAGIGQSDSEIVDLVDFPMYVMTSDYGAASQLEKIDMLDLAELVVINKFDKRGAEDALRDVRKQWKRNRVAFELAGRRGAGLPDDRQPVQRSGRDLDVRQPVPAAARQAAPAPTPNAGRRSSTPTTQGAARQRADPRQPRALPRRDRRAGPRRSTPSIEKQAEAADRAQALLARRCRTLGDPKLPEAARALSSRRSASCVTATDRAAAAAPALQRRAEGAHDRGDRPAARMAARGSKSITAEHYSYEVRGKAVDRRQLPSSRCRTRRSRRSPRPRYKSWGDLLRVPDEGEPAGLLSVHRRRVSRTGARARIRPRMFAGEGTPGAHQPPLPLSVARDRRRRGSRPRSTRSRCTAKTRTSGRTSTARSATRASSIATARRREEALLGLRPVRADAPRCR